MIPIEFLEEYKVKDVHSKSWNGGVRLIVDFEDGRSYNRILMGANYDQVIESARTLILKNSIVIQRSKKINKLISKI